MPPVCDKTPTVSAAFTVNVPVLDTVTATALPTFEPVPNVREPALIPTAPLIIPLFVTPPPVTFNAPAIVPVVAIVVRPDAAVVAPAPFSVPAIVPPARDFAPDAVTVVPAAIVAPFD